MITVKLLKITCLEKAGIIWKYAEQKGDIYTIILSILTLKGYIYQFKSN